MEFENENKEFKLIATEDIYKEVIAFANSIGGTIYVGVDDLGNTIGIDNIDATYTKITNGIRDAILPDVTMFIKYKLNDDKTLEIIVGEGSSKPYFLKSKGLKSSGVFIRQGASSAQASFDQIKQMIKETDGDIYESMRSMNQTLTFESAKNFFKERKIEFSSNKYIALGITNEKNSVYTNLAHIISDQCTHTIKIAVFEDDSNTKFHSTQEFKGSIFSQLEQAYNYLLLCNNTPFTFDGLERIEKPDYPKEALREALVNSIVHRDYSFSGSTIINVNKKQIEFISLGGLVSSLTVDDIKAGISQPRNKKLCEIFHRLFLIEAYGTGIRRIFGLYKDNFVKPQIVVTKNTFKLILPNMNTNNDPLNEPLVSETNVSETQTSSKNTKISNYNSSCIKSNGLEEKESITKAPSESITINLQMKKILEYLKNNKSINSLEIQELLNIKSTRCYLLLKEMENIDLITSIGKGKNKVYVLK